MPTRQSLRALAQAVLCELTGAERVTRLCPTCGSAAHGQPRLVGSDLSVSISYAGRLVAVAWGPGPVGVDVERTTRRTPPGWTCIEALAKAAGTGLREWPHVTPPPMPVRPLTAADGLPAGHIGTLADTSGAAQVRILTPSQPSQAS